MTLSELEDALDEILPPGFSIETNKKGEIVVFTNLKEEEEDEDLVIFDDDEIDPDQDPDFHSINDEDFDEDE